MDVFLQKWMYSVKLVVFWVKVVVIVQSGFFRAKWLYLGKSGCILAKCLLSCKVVVFVHGGCNRAKCLRLGNVVVFGQRV